MQKQKTSWIRQQSNCWGSTYFLIFFSIAYLFLFFDLYSWGKRDSLPFVSDSQFKESNTHWQPYCQQTSTHSDVTLNTDSVIKYRDLRNNAEHGKKILLIYSLLFTLPARTVQMNNFPKYDFTFASYELFTLPPSLVKSKCPQKRPELSWNCNTHRLCLLSFEVIHNPSLI